MNYTRERSKEILAQLLGLAGDEQGEASGLLSELSDGQSEIFNSYELGENKIKELENRVEELKEQNMDLFLKTGSMIEPEKPETEPEEEEETKDYEDLFDENGELI